jgi:hypothetical protein
MLAIKRLYFLALQSVGGNRKTGPSPDITASQGT